MYVFGSVGWYDKATKKHCRILINSLTSFPSIIFFREVLNVWTESLAAPLSHLIYKKY